MMKICSGVYPKTSLAFLLVIIATIASVLSSTPQVLANTPESDLDLQINLQAQNPDPNQELEILQSNAKALYLNGRYPEAIAVIKNLITAQNNQGEIFNQARSYRNLALIYLQIGYWRRADEAIQTSYSFLSQTDAGQFGFEQLQLDIQELEGQLLLKTGNPRRALKTWQGVKLRYEQKQDFKGMVRNSINEVQALRILGLYYQAFKKLEQLEQVLEPLPDNVLKAKMLHTLGDVLQSVGQVERADGILKQSINMVQAQKDNVGNQPLLGDLLLSLGNGASLNKQHQTAAYYYQQAFAIAPEPEVRVLALLNELEIYVNDQNWEQANGLSKAIQESLKVNQPSRDTIYSRINFVENLILMGPHRRIGTNYLLETCLDAIAESEMLGDRRAMGYAYGTLGRLYEAEGRYSEAIELTEKALILSQGLNAPDLIYQWQWQLGRIYYGQGNRAQAITAYDQASRNLKTIRGDLAAISSDAQFSFQESVEPLYREFASILLQDQPTQSELKQALGVIDSLQIAELDNFFRDACLDIKPLAVKTLDPKGAIFYNIILNDRLETVVSIPGQPLKNHKTLLTKPEIELVLNATRDRLTNRRREVPYPLLEFLHRKLITPVEQALEQANVETLVFISDGLLQNIPMAALYDGEQYLIEKYRLAVAPSLELVDIQGRSSQQIQLLGAGLSESRQGFTAIPAVKSELNNIQDSLRARVLLNETFTEENLRKLITESSYPIVHIASHGEFSSKSEDNFILTWNDRIDINELDAILRKNLDYNEPAPIELLVLSACKTAVGDNRATLGLAGLAIKAGAKSTMASLWSVDDAATAQLMSSFYEQLAGQSIPKSEALRRAQLQALAQEKYSHPYYWSAFVMIGNWL